MIHDAQFLISPESFPLRFRVGYKMLTPLIAASSERVLTVSEYARDSLEAFHVARHRRTEVIYNGADHILEVAPDCSIFDKLRLRKSYAIVFGSTAVYKNVQVVFEAFRQRDLGVQLVVLGASRRAFLDAAMDPPLNAVFAGQVSDGELRALYEGAACLLFPSRTEGFGLPPVEAMACGCPVIAAPAGAIPEVCRDAVLYADIFSPEDWSGHIKTLLTRPDVRAAKVEAGRRRSSRFTWRAAGRRLLDCIVEVASG
jgi:glycosyltransferase involved in cell wall biosynthesis